MINTKLVRTNVYDFIKEKKKLDRNISGKIAMASCSRYYKLLLMNSFIKP